MGELAKSDATRTPGCTLKCNKSAKSDHSRPELMPISIGVGAVGQRVLGREGGGGRHSRQSKFLHSKISTLTSLNVLVRVHALDSIHIRTQLRHSCQEHTDVIS